jgi:hypothetical protein
MKKLLVIVLMAVIATIAPAESVHAQDPISQIINAGIKKVIKAVDLKIQRLQNETIWLQNAQKTLENTMSKLKLNDITDWVEKQRLLYRDYFEELYKVKDIITYYQRIKDIGKKQIKLVEEYKRAWGLIKQDKHFSSDEFGYMAKVYSGIIDESVKNIDQIFLVINSFQTQMTDAKRLELINAAADQADNNYFDLTQFNEQNILLSLERAKGEQDVESVKKLYGLQ